MFSCTNLSADPWTECLVMFWPASVTDVQGRLENRRNTGGEKSGIENNLQIEQVQL